MAQIQIFLSTVSAEFRSYRDALRRDLERPNVTVKVQEDFIATGTETLDKLDEYIRQCDAVIHLVGDMTGALAQEPSVAAIRRCYPDIPERFPVMGPFLNPGAPALSYTQWEAWLALYHRKVLIIAAPEDGTPRDEHFQLIEAQRDAQQAHLARLASVERIPEIKFSSDDRLAVAVLRSKIQEILALAGPLKRPVNLPYLSINALFKGREAGLDVLRSSLGAVPQSGSTPVVARVLTGMGGVGKTRLAVEYAWRHTNDYAALLFVDANDPEALQRNLASLSGRTILDLPEQGEMDQGKQRDAVLGWLRLHSGWLLILDNIDSEEAARAAEALLPQLLGGHALLTSRMSNWSSSLPAVGVDMLSPEAAADFLLARTDARRRKHADDPAAAGTLAEELGHLALALEQAGAYITQRMLGFAQYLAEWQAQGERVLAWSDSRLMNYPKSVAITWQTSFDRLGEPARRLLRRLSWLAPEPIPESLLDVAVPEPADPDLLGALAELEAYSLISRDPDTHLFSIHRLVQEVSRRSQPAQAAHATILEALLWIDAAFNYDPQDVRTWAVLDPLAAHAQTIAAHGDAVGISNPTVVLLGRVGLLLWQKAQYSAAAPLFERALAISEKVLGPDHPGVATSLNNMALLHVSRSAYAKAEPLHVRALAIYEKTLGPDHLDVATGLNNLAQLYGNQGAYAKAEPLFVRALTIYEMALGPDDPRVASVLNNLAMGYENQGAYEKATPLIERALTIQEKTLGSEHPDVARSLNNLTGLLVRQGAYARATPLIERALVIFEKSLGPWHPEVGASLNTLAFLHHNQGFYAKAVPLCERELAIQEKVLGPEHPDVAQTLNNLAVLYRIQRAYANAEPLFERALTILKKALEAEHPSVAATLSNLAVLYHDQDLYSKAEQLYEEAIAIRERTLGHEHPDLVTNLNNLALLYRNQGFYGKASLFMRRALSISIGNLGADHPTSRTLTDNYADLLRAMGNTEEAIASDLASLSQGNDA